MTDTQLKPCPFCNSNMLVSTMEWDRGNREMNTIECSACGGRTNDFETKPEAIEAWNTRANTLTDAAWAVVEAAVAWLRSADRRNGMNHIQARYALGTAVEALQKEREL